MGAQGSKSHNDTQAGEPEVQDYYALLEVSESATQDEIKASDFGLVCLSSPFYLEELHVRS